MTRCFVAMVILVATSTGAHAQSETAISYQGVLNENGQVANGLFDMSFSLWDALAGGSQVGATINLVDVSVLNGRFTVELDFGANAFDNSARWLEIVVETTTLSPRQPINRAPYSIQTRGMFIGDDGNITFNGLSGVEGTVTMTSLGGIDLIIDADTNNAGGED